MQLPGSLVEDPPAWLVKRREWVFLVLAGLFLGTLAMLNILGIARFWTIAALDSDGTFALGRWADVGGWSFAVAIGVLPYPITFLCTDLISEFFGRTRANRVVLVGLILNIWIAFVMWLAGAVPGSGAPVDAGTVLPDGRTLPDGLMTSDAFFIIRALTFNAVAASMIAYLAAQLVDVQVFHIVKRFTKGRMLWLRNNTSTLVSQFVDTFAVITITHFSAKALPIDDTAAIWPQLWTFILTGYAFKAAVAMLDTPVIYLAAWWLKGLLQADPTQHETGPRGFDQVTQALGEP
ncbi:MAG: queuosine precursor transporter [Planctomycetota bacterium]